MDLALTNNTIVMMVLLPMLGGVIGVVTRRSGLAQRLVSGLMLIGGAVCGGWLLSRMPEGGALVSRLGQWPAPFGIVLVFDALSGVLMTASCLVGAATLLGATREHGDRYQTAWMAPLVSMLVFGVNFSFLTGDLFNLFVAFEIMLMASYGLALRNASARAVKQAHKYVVVNLFASAMFVFGAGLVYGVTGTLNMADLVVFAQEVDPLPQAFSAAGVILLFVFALKAAVFPLFLWLPDTYHALPAAMGGLFAALLSKVGMYALLRVVGPIFAGSLEGIGYSTVVGVLAGGTMLVAALCALGVPTVRRVMSFVLIAHMGYALFMLSLGTPGSLGAASYLLAQEMFVIAGLYMVGGAFERALGTDDLRRIACMHRSMPWLTRCAFVLTIAGAGLPPTAAFVAKAWIVQEGVRAGAWWLTGLMLVSALLMLLALIRAWCAGFWRLRDETLTPAKGPHEIEPSSRWQTVAVASLTLGVVGTAIGGSWLHGLMMQAGATLHDPAPVARSILVAPAEQFPDAPEYGEHK